VVLIERQQRRRGEELTRREREVLALLAEGLPNKRSPTASGSASGRSLIWMLKKVADVEIPIVFPAWNVVIALVGTIVLALQITFLPVRRAVRFRPGEAIRYA
jgi:hypothetical protein